MGSKHFGFSRGTVAKATSNLISTLGFQPRVGHTFTEEEEKPRHNVVLLTDGFWKRRYGADPAIVGKTVPLDGLQYLLVGGILPPEFNLPDSRAVGELSGTDKPIEAFVPFGWSPEQLQQLQGDHNYFAIARLRDGIGIGRANAELNALEPASPTKSCCNLCPSHNLMSLFKCFQLVRELNFHLLRLMLVTLEPRTTRSSVWLCTTFGPRMSEACPTLPEPSATVWVWCKRDGSISCELDRYSDDWHPPAKTTDPAVIKLLCH